MFVYKRGMSLQYLPASTTTAPRACALKVTPIATSTDNHVDGRKERVQFDKITARVSRLCYGLDPEHVDAAAITMKVIAGVYQGVNTIQLDDLVSTVCLPSRALADLP